MRRALMLLAVLALLAAACGEGQSVGSERLLEGVDQGETGPRLGERELEEEEEEGTPAPLTVAEEPTPEPATPAPEVRYFEVTLIADSPFIHPGNQLITFTGVTLRVTNQDTSPERPTRSFTAEDGSFDSGLLPPGESWTREFTGPGFWRIIDRGVPFVSATLEVQ